MYLINIGFLVATYAHIPSFATWCKSKSFNEAWRNERELRTCIPCRMVCIGIIRNLLPVYHACSIQDNSISHNGVS